MSYSYPAGLVDGRLPQRGEVTVRAQASFGGGTAVLDQAFRVSCGILGAVPAALTSRPDISVRGNAQVIGYDFAGDSGAYPVTRVLSPGVAAPLPADTFTLTVADASLIPVGSYVQIPSPTSPKTYLVTGVSGNALTLRPLSPPGPTDAILPGNAAVLQEYRLSGLSCGSPTSFTASGFPLLDLVDPGISPFALVSSPRPGVDVTLRLKARSGSRVVYAPGPGAVYTLRVYPRNLP